jgi:SAM-dependent methyltransferase
MNEDLALHPWLEGGNRCTLTIPTVAQYLLGLTPRPKRVFDTGCGNGELLRLLWAGGVPAAGLWGIDVEPGHAQLARRRTGLVDHILMGDIAEHRWPDRLDVVTAINWLQTDWPNSEYAINSRRAANPDRLKVFVRRCGENLLPNGLLIWDWNCEGIETFRELLDRNRWRSVHTLAFPGTEDNPVHVYTRP